MQNFHDPWNRNIGASLSTLANQTVSLLVTQGPGCSLQSRSMHSATDNIFHMHLNSTKRPALVQSISWTCYLIVIRVLLLSNAFLRYHLDCNALEVDWKTSLQLVRAHAKDLHSLLQVDVRIMVFIQDGKTVVS